MYIEASTKSSNKKMPAAIMSVDLRTKLGEFSITGARCVNPTVGNYFVSKSHMTVIDCHKNDAPQMRGVVTCLQFILF